MSDVLVKVDNVSKKFCRGLKRSLMYGMQDLGSELIGRNHGNNGILRKEEFWAVKDVSFELKRGECLGLIGRNGAGKSTLLKMLHGLIKPDEGRIEMRGRVGALIELGSGFNPILTGRENIYINASVLGFKKKEIDALFDQIVEFSELEEFIDTPLMYYSSGMKVRLGFSVAIHMNPDVLILDEVLAVGDAGFKMKSLNKMIEMMSKAAVIFVSHSMTTISRICSGIIFLKEGETLYSGDNIAKGIELYFDQHDIDDMYVQYNEKAQIHRMEIKSAQNRGKDDKGRNLVNYLDDLIIEIELSVDRGEQYYELSFTFTDKETQNIAMFQTDLFYEPFSNTNIKQVHVFKLPYCTFPNGDYSVSVKVVNKKDAVNSNAINILAKYNNMSKFKVVGVNVFYRVPNLMFTNLDEFKNSRAGNNNE